MSLTLNQIVAIANADTEFTPGMSSDELFYANQTSERLTDVIATVADGVLDKADLDHTHTGYAPAAHTHTEYAETDHTHTEYAETDHTHTGYAPATHTHTPASIGAAEATHSHDYAASNHAHSYNDLSDKPTIPAAYSHPASHPASMITGLADVATSGSYNDLANKPTIPEAYSHPASHPASMITGLADVATSGSYNDLTNKPTIPTIPASLPANGGNADTVDGKHASDFATASHSHNYAAPSHTHAQADVTGLVDALSAKANVSELSTKADLVDGKIPTSQLPGYVDDVLEYTALANFPATGESGKIYVATGTNKTYRWSGSAYVEISASLALGETSATAYRGDRGKTAYDHSQNGAVHVTAAQKTTWDSKAAGDHSHSYNDLSDKPTIPAAYSHPASHPASMITGLADVATSGSYNDLSDKPSIPTIPASLPANGGNADTVDGKHASDFASASHTHSAVTTSAAGLMSAADKTKLDGIATGANKITVDSALSSSSTNPVQNKVINTALAGKAASSHNHDSAYMAKSLQMTDDAGNVQYSCTTSSNNNLLTQILNMPVGVHTVYSQTGVTGNPKTTEAWRCMVHKTAASIGWVMAYGSSGSVYSNYVDGNGWKGWRCIFDANPEPLWSGTSYLSSSNGTPQTVTPKKKLSECRNGWLLLWSDQDPGVGPNDSDFCTTMIPKYTPSGGTWGGKAFYCDIPMYVGSDTDNLSTEKRCIKPIYVHDNKIAGSYQNTSAGRNDVVLRAIYEF